MKVKKCLSSAVLNCCWCGAICCGVEAAGQSGLAQSVSMRTFERTSTMQQPSEELSRSMEALASELSVSIAGTEARADLAAQIGISPRKGMLTMQDYVRASMRTGLKSDPAVALQLTARVEQIEETMNRCALKYPRLELKLPVREHRDLLETADFVYVAVAPMMDESEVKSIVAYKNGERVMLDAAQPPAEPTLVLLPAEIESADPHYPLLKSQDPGEKSRADRIVDDYVGIARIWIDDDHENWWCGDPEIYVRVLRFRFDTFTLYNQSVSLPGVNDEQVWYDIGDPNGTYKYVSTSNYAPVIQFQVWEADSGTHGSDDYLGTVTVTWTGLSFSGYTTFTNGDVRIRVDRD